MRGPARPLFLWALIACAIGLVSCTTPGTADPTPTSTPTPTETATPAVAIPLCTTPPGGTELPGGADSLEIADQLVRDNRPDLAKTIYQGVLKEDPENGCAARGLARIDADAKAEAAKNVTGANAAATAVAKFAKDHLIPLGNAALPTLVCLIALVAIASAAARRVVSPNEVARRPRVVRAAVFGGLLTVAVALIPFVVATQDAAPPRWGAPAVLFVGAAVLGAALVLTGGLSERTARVAATALLIGLGAIAFAASDAGSWPLSLWVAAAALGTLGVMCLAVALGHRLRLRVDAFGQDGEASTKISRAVVSRLAFLGSTPPKGLEVAEGTDVTTLPEDALKATTTSSAIAALLSAIRGVINAVPWRAVVALEGPGRAVVSLHRNGRAAAPATVIDVNDFGLGSDDDTEAEDEKKPDASQEDALVTAVASFLLAELAKRHPGLRVGLCGASRWKSIALHAVAGNERLVADKEKRPMLRREAVAVDPANDLAQIALLWESGRHSDAADQQREFVQELEKKYETMIGSSMRTHAASAAPKKAGYDALQLRMLYVAAATWLNVSLLSPPGSSAASPSGEPVVAAFAIASLLLKRVDALLQVPDEEKLCEFAKDMKGSAAYLWEGAANGRQLPPGHSDRAEGQAIIDRWQLPATGLDKDALYDRACTHAERYLEEADPVHLEKALADLKLALVSEHDRHTARDDPSFAVFYEDATPEPCRSAFKEIVGDDPPKSIVDIEPFKFHADGLRDWGVTTTRQLQAVRAEHIADRLGVHVSAVRHWPVIAKLAEERVRKNPADDEDTKHLTILQILLAAGVSSTGALDEKLRANDEARQKFKEKLAEKAKATKVVPLDSETFEVWQSRRAGIAQSTTPGE